MTAAMPSKSGSGSAVLPGGSALPPPLSVATAHHLTTLSHILQVCACHLTTLTHMLSHMLSLTLSRILSHILTLILSHILSHILQVCECHATHACSTSCVSIMYHLTSFVPPTHNDCAQLKPCLPLSPQEYARLAHVLPHSDSPSSPTHTHTLIAPRSMHASPTSSPHSGSPSSSTSLGFRV